MILRQNRRFQVYAIHLTGQQGFAGAIFEGDQFKSVDLSIELAQIVQRILPILQPAGTEDESALE